RFTDEALHLGRRQTFAGGHVVADRMLFAGSRYFKNRFGLLDRRLLVVDVDPRATRARVDLDAALLEEAADAADQSLAAARDHRVGAEVGADPRQQHLDRRVAV